jgi:hypothetical protein
MSFDDLEEERTKLFNEVWKEPMTTVAKRYELSDNGLRKRCVKFEIPLPPVGYWAKLEAGKEVTPQPKLMPLKVNQQIQSEKNANIFKLINNWSHSIEELKELDSLELLTPESKVKFLDWCKNIRVPKRIDKYNPLIYEYQNEITYRKARDEEHQFRDMIGLPFGMAWARQKIVYRNNKAVLPLSVSDKQATRALTIMDTLIHLVNELDGSVIVESGEKDNASFRLFEQSYSFQMTEIMVKQRSLLLNAESEHIVDFRPMYEKVPSGILEIEIKIISNYRESDKSTNAVRLVDSVEVTIEKRLGEMFTELLRTAIVSKIESIVADREYKEGVKEQQRVNEIEEDNRKKFRELEKQAKELEEQTKRKQRLIENIENQMAGWDKSRKLLKFAEELEAFASDICDDTIKGPLITYVDFVREKANKCDPVADILNEVKAL